MVVTLSTDHAYSRIYIAVIYTANFGAAQELGILSSR